MPKLKFLKPKKKAKVKPEIKVESELKVEEKVEVLETPVMVEPEKLIVRGVHKFRKVKVNHLNGDVTTHLEQVE
mgnify:CR=1 FL=1